MFNWYASNIYYLKFTFSFTDKNLIMVRRQYNEEEATIEGEFYEMLCIYQPNLKNKNMTRELEKAG